MEGPRGALDELLILASPRCGTNYFCESLQSFPEIAAFYELFNPDSVIGVGPRSLPSLNAALGLSAESCTDAELRRIFREQPLVALEALGSYARVGGRSLMAYKVLSEQLPQETVDLLIAGERRHPLFLVRGRLDVYVSLVKAEATDTYHSRSTVDLLPEIEVAEFLRWAERTDDFYRRCLQAAHDSGKPYGILRYETDVDLPREDLLPRIRTTLAHLGLEVELPQRAKPARFKRQDLRVSPFQKMANGDDLRSELQAIGALDYALSAPLAENPANRTQLSSRP